MHVFGHPLNPYRSCTERIAGREGPGERRGERERREEWRESAAAKRCGAVAGQPVRVGEDMCLVKAREPEVISVAFGKFIIKTDQSFLEASARSIDFRNDLGLPSIPTKLLENSDTHSLMLVKLRHNSAIIQKFHRYLANS